MIVPEYWAEARASVTLGGKDRILRRFGWSNDSQESAEAHARTRLAQAQQDALNGRSIPSREARTAYNGAVGVPIREEIVTRHGATIVTRNGYGALCLNTPDVLFADIDFAQSARLTTYVVAMIACVAASLVLTISLGRNDLAVPVVFVAAVVAITLVNRTHRIWLTAGNGAEARARKRIGKFAASHPEWALRVYRTPAGLRVLVMHQTFRPSEPAVESLFAALRVDPVYAQMCRNQNCFRARVSPKPWRIGTKSHIRPHRGGWPVKPEWLPLRAQWIAEYEVRARHFAACRYVEQLGSSSEHRSARAIQQLHDELCRAHSNLPLA
jgi:hypothetical protein